MRPLTALIVDDEPPARRELRRLLEALGSVVIVGEAATIADTERSLAVEVPDVVFLDIRLGTDLGFRLVPEVPARTAIVFVTAHDQYAVRAFETHALDYLLKPVELPRLAQALERVRTRQTPAQSDMRDRPEATSSLEPRDWLLLRDGLREEFVRVASIAAIVADGDYTRVGTVDGRTRHVHQSLRSWESRLPATFVRVHRGSLINLAHALAIDRGPGLATTVRLRGQAAIAISRREGRRLRAALAGEPTRESER